MCSICRALFGEGPKLVGSICRALFGEGLNWWVLFVGHSSVRVSTGVAAS